MASPGGLPVVGCEVGGEKRLPMCIALSILAVPAVVAASSIKSDEVVVFFDTWAYQDRDAGQWTIPIHGWVFEPETRSPGRAVLLSILGKALDVDNEARGSELFRKRARLFLVDNQGGKPIFIRMGDRKYYIGESQSNGHFEGALRLPEAQVAALLNSQHASGPAPASRWGRFEVALRASDTRTFSGSVEFLERTGVSVISDIDDTIRLTGIGNSKAVLRSTFLQDLKPVPGMAEVYRRWAVEGASFHCVSDCPWQLYPVLSEFLTVNGFPRATFSMKAFRLKDSTLFDLFADPQATKPPAIESIIAALPDRRFVLVGDSGQKDPEIYGQIARKHPQQVSFVFIHSVNNEPEGGERFATALRGVPPHKWRIFRQADELLSVDLGTAATRPATATAP
jgi:hypothetical protein